jgi:hypothetical protein
MSSKKSTPATAQLAKELEKKKRKETVDVDITSDEERHETTRQRRKPSVIAAPVCCRTWEEGDLTYFCGYNGSVGCMETNLYLTIPLADYFAFCNVLNGY